MDTDSILDSFMEGFAKTAEAAGFQGDQVRELLELGVTLAQREANSEAFDSGFTSIVTRA